MPRRPVRFVLASVITGLCVAGCGTSSSLLGNGRPSSQELSLAVLDAIQRRDVTSLRSLALSEQEFRDHVWPELPASRPERNLPFSYVWGDLHQKSEIALTQTLARHGGRRYVLVAVRFTGEVTRYPGYTVYRETVLKVRDEAGEEHDLRLFGSSLEKEDVWKVFSYVVDD